MPKNRTGRLKIFLLVLVCIGLFAYLFSDDLHVYLNARKIADRLQYKNPSRIEDAIPFDYDAIVFFPPYTDAESIETTLGAKSRFIRPGFSENMINAYVMLEGRVAAFIYGYMENFDKNRVLAPYIKEMHEKNAPLHVAGKAAFE